MQNPFAEALLYGKQGRKGQGCKVGNLILTLNAVQQRLCQTLLLYVWSTGSYDIKNPSTVKFKSLLEYCGAGILVEANLVLIDFVNIREANNCLV